MPKKKIENDESEYREFHFGDTYDGDSEVKVWCDGRAYDPDTETYRQIYSYSITAPKFQYVNNDIHGAANDQINLDSGAQSLFAFLYACQEGDTDLFPPQVREWAHHYSEEISLLSMELQEKGGENDRGKGSDNH